MRKKPRNPNLDPDGAYDTMRWAIRRMIQAERGGPPVPSDPDDWCLLIATSFRALGLSEPVDRKQIRCPRCKRRLLPCALHCVGGEFICWLVPPHKKPTKKKKSKPVEKRGRLGRRM